EGSGFAYNPAGMSTTYQLFKDGIDFTSAGSGSQELHIDFTQAASPLLSDELLAPGGVSLRTVVPPVNATGQSTATAHAGGGGVGEFASPAATLTTTPTVKAWAAPKLANVAGSVTITSVSLASNATSTSLGGGGLIAVQEADTTTNFGTLGTGATPAVNK